MSQDQEVAKVTNNCRMLNVWEHLSSLSRLAIYFRMQALYLVGFILAYLRSLPKLP